jgi:Mn-dependent DtxR family transcriptional regulator
MNKPLSLENNSSSTEGECGSGYANEHEVWKNFNQNQITHSIAHYLMAIDEASEGSEYGCKAVNVSRILGVSRNAVSLQLKTLQQHEFIHLSGNKLIALTERGKTVVNNVVAARRSVKRFLVQFLGVTEELAEQDSCKVEHLISQETRNGLAKLIQFVGDQPALATPFIEALNNYQVHCEEDSQHHCPLCQHGCLLKDNIS